MKDIVKKNSCFIVTSNPGIASFLKERIAIMFDDVLRVDIAQEVGEILQTPREKGYQCIIADIDLVDKIGTPLIDFFQGYEGELIFILRDETDAIKAFSYNASACILDINNDHEIFTTLNKCLERVGYTKEIVAKKAGLNNRIAIPCKNHIEYVLLEDIVYLESVGRGTKVVTKNGILDCTQILAKFSFILENTGFFQIHRSYTVNLNQVIRYESSGVVVMSNKDELPVSRTVKRYLVQLLHG